MALKEITRFDKQGYPIILSQYTNRKTSYHIQYGSQEHLRLSFNEAAEQLGYCIMHQLESEGKLIG